MVKVVLVDNDPIVQRAVSRGLQHSCVAFDFKVATIPNIENEMPDIILIDCVQEHGLGLSLVQKIRQSKRLGSRPIIALGKDNLRGDLEREWLNNVEIDDFMAKPLLPQVIDAKIIVVLRGWDRSRIPTRLCRGKASAASQTLSVLLVEDNSEDVALLYEVLKDNFTIRVKNKWPLCQEYLLAAATVLPEIILLDIWFGENEDGFRAIEWIRQQPALKSIPIVVLSAAFSGDDIAKGLALGASDYVVKPIRPELIKDRLWLSYIRSQSGVAYEG